MLLGVFPVTVIALIDPVNVLLVGSRATAGTGSNWLLLAPINADRSSYSPLIVLVVIVAIVLLTIAGRPPLLPRPRAPRAAVGLRLPAQTPRMQDTAEGFGQPIRQVFEPFFRIERHLPSPFDAAAALLR